MQTELEPQLPLLTRQEALFGTVSVVALVVLLVRVSFVVDNALVVAAVVMPAVVAVELLVELSKVEVLETVLL